MNKKYVKQSSGQSEVGIVKLACCDCGLVHAMGFTDSEDGILQLQFLRDNKATAQLRRGSFAYLKNPSKGDKWRIIRNTER